MKKLFTATLATLMSICLVGTAFGALLVVDAAGNTQQVGDPVPGYNPYSAVEAIIPQPPRRNDLVDYPLPFTCVCTDNVTFVLSQATENSLALTMSDPNEYFRYIGEEGDFYRIMFDGGDAYIKKSAGTLKDTIKMDPGLELRAQLIYNAFSNLGARYTYGGTSAATGFDCSGYLYSTFASCGISIGHSTSEQVLEGIPVDVSQIRPGDLIFYGTTPATVTHGAMYVGNGMLIHSHSTGMGVRMQSYNYKSEAPLCINNVLGDVN